MTTDHREPQNEETLRVVLIEDDERLARLTAKYLESHGVLVNWVADGRAGLAEVLRVRPDAVLLDLQLPGLDGVSVCRELRGRSDVPIIMITARDEEADRVLGLELGADDYVPKPFSSRELLARVRAQVRRARGRAGPSSNPIRVGALTLEPATLRAKLSEQELTLTAYEFTLLRVLAENAGRVLGREQLLYLAKGNAEESFDRSIDVQISRLRSKLGDDPKNPRFLKTVRGLGYVLVPERS
ncbi:MAG: response regulator transcription factor [Polyangiales bacterium]